MKFILDFRGIIPNVREFPDVGEFILNLRKFILNIREFILHLRGFIPNSRKFIFDLLGNLFSTLVIYSRLKFNLLYYFCFIQDRTSDPEFIQDRISAPTSFKIGRPIFLIKDRISDSEWDNSGSDTIYILGWQHYGRGLGLSSATPVAPCASRPPLRAGCVVARAVTSAAYTLS